MIHAFSHHASIIKSFLFLHTKLLADTPLDNTAADWAKDAVNWALRNGILKGDERGDLLLHSPVTREQLCVMLKRYTDLP